jgi:hypothetical protein
VVKRPEREVDHIVSSNAEIKNEWSYTYSPLYAFTAWAGSPLPLPSHITGNCAFWVHELR